MYDPEHDEPLKDNCPCCERSFDDGSIADRLMYMHPGKTLSQVRELIKLYYNPPYRYNKKIAITLDKDRVEYFLCPFCKCEFIDTEILRRNNENIHSNN